MCSNKEVLLFRKGQGKVIIERKRVVVMRQMIQTNMIYQVPSLHGGFVHNDKR